MTTKEKLDEFKQSFTKLVADAVNDRVPIQNLILELETEKFRLNMLLFNVRAEQAAQAEASAI